MKSIMTNTTSTLTIDQALQQAVAYHTQGQLQEAEELYRAILHVQPDHPDANNNLGVLAVQMQQPTASLPYFKAALEASPNQGQYWRRYIDALIQAGQIEVARDMLEQGRQQGLQGEELDALAGRLEGGAQVAGQANTAAVKETPAVPSTVLQNSKKKSKTKPDKSSRKSAQHKGKNPSPQEINTLVALFNEGRYIEAISLAQTMTERFPQHGFGWKALGAMFKQLGRNADALIPMQKAAALSQDDAEAHSNLGCTLYELGQLDEAETSYRRALKIKPDYAEAHYNLGNTLQELRRLDEAEASYRRALKINPNYAEAHYNLGNTFKDLGQLDEAEASYRRALGIKPDHAEAHNNLGLTFNGLSRLGEAEASYRRALEINPDYVEAYSNLGNTLMDMGRMDEAEASYRQALGIKSNIAEPHYNLGNTLEDLGRLDEAEVSYRRALEINPDYAGAHSNLGNALKDMGRLDEAEASYRRALELEPDYAGAHSNLGNALKDLGRLDEAEACYRRALQIEPDYAEAHNNLGNILNNDMGRLGEAEGSYRRALQIKPDYAEAHSNLGIALMGLGRLDEAEVSCRLALQIEPDYAGAHSNLGNVLKDLGRLDEAEACYRRALQIEPDYAEAHYNLGGILLAMGRLDEAEASYRPALEIKPDFVEGYHNLLFSLSHNETVDAETLFYEHCRFGEQFETPFRANRPPHTNSRTPERTLQIGFVSGDLRNHAVASFIEPVLAHLSSYPQLSLHAYSNHATEDAVTQRLRGYFAYWHPIVGLSDAALAEKIRADSIDILIDLSGHTAKNRLLAFARKPAPVQASWMGYPGTTGLQAMDYYSADRFFLPPGQFDDQFTEKLVYLPAGAPFMPSNEAPSVNALPALNNGFVTFGSFNRLSKISPSVIALWSQLLRALPESRIVLGAMPQDGYDALIDWFAQEGVVRERLSFYTRCGMGAYLALHHQVDICLDTFPYGGGTTTFHALSMGVPTLTLAGSTAAGRSGASILGNVGLEAFIAHDAADFVQKGLLWSANLAALSDTRTELRERFSKSAVGQPALITAGLERALRIMWQCWCDDLPPAVLDVSGTQINHAVYGDGK